MLQLLFVDDKPEEVEPVLKLVGGEEDMSHHWTNTVDKAKGLIQSIRPDIVILDLKLIKHESGTKLDGIEIENLIWDDHFCPVVIYSGFVEAYEQSDDNERGSHPLVEIVGKGRDSENQVMDAIRSFGPYALAIQDVVRDIQSLRHAALRDVVPYIIDAIPDKGADEQVENVRVTVKRRIASMMDEPLSSDNRLAARTQYLIPPMGDSIALGDILRKKDGSSNSPADFRVVLTPSCDMVTSPGRMAKVSNVLVAKCAPIKTLIENTTIGEGPMNRKRRDRIRGSVLTSGLFETMIPFPRFSEHIPSMGADMKELELVPLAQIGVKSSKKLYWRIASIDSPFRELISWAYLQVAGRPGLPDRDFDSWVEEIVGEW